MIWASSMEWIPAALLNGEESGHYTSVYTQHEVTWIQESVKWKTCSFVKKVPSSVTIATLVCFAKKCIQNLFHLNDMKNTIKHLLNVAFKT